MKIIGQDLLPFDMQYPVYNFFYPNSGSDIEKNSITKVIENASKNTKHRAIYIHIPFCDTLCSFCPFTRGRVTDSNIIELYVQALINEIRWKAQQYDLTQPPINAIFFGGGTPSMMSAEQIERVGHVLHKHFDLTQVKEFSFEIEVKSLTPEKAQAMRQIGVTHPRFGLQSFSKKWRDIFTLTATLEQIYSSLNILSKTFDNVSVDILYGMSGHTEEELILDLKHACDTGVSNIDIYPIDNIMTQPALHKALKKLNYLPTSATRKLSMNVLADTYLRSRGYMPHNGHGYRNVGVAGIKSDIVIDTYRFEYHEHVYGYQDYDLLGFGVSAISNLHGAKLINTNQRSKYISQFTQNDTPENTFHVTQHGLDLDILRPLALRLPYFGSVDKSRMNYDLISTEAKQKIKELKNAGLIIENPHQLTLTKTGWYNYANLMYYLIPNIEQNAMDNFIAEQLTGSARDITKNEILFSTDA
ncbi:coproporphyrinogen-III oxidase family protein [Pseudomonas cichorii]|uniref:coproporphyrinogen-III oxidase family protein n=1 Tax=Pseudomonas cichorii TaxID=36746 RepID=UPI001C8A6CEF|nr:radical SAM protein [Pseudomonas cichorii]MBX8496732.1 radical SAM protein [Pseudomonas cichorii]